MLKVEDVDNIILKSIKNSICTDLKSGYVSLEIQRLSNIAAFLDPRFTQLDPFVAEIDREDLVKDVITEVLLGCKQNHQDNESVESSQLNDDMTAPATKKRRSSFQIIGLCNYHTLSYSNQFIMCG